MSFRANIYVLGLIEFDREEVVLKKDQLNQIENRIGDIVSYLNGEKIDQRIYLPYDQRIYLPYKVWSLPKSAVLDYSFRVSSMDIDFWLLSVPTPNDDPMLADFIDLSSTANISDDMPRIEHHTQHFC
jgi:hypothetical protein